MHLDDVLSSRPPRAAGQGGGQANEKRDQAELLYIGKGLDLGSIATELEVGKRTVERWSAAGHWTAKRAAFRETVREEVLQKMGTAAIQHRIDELDRIRTIRERGYKLLEDEATLPKSWEGVAKVILEIERRSEELVVAVGSDLVPGSNKPAGLVAAASGAPFSDSEKRTVVEALLHRRREELRQMLPAPVDAGLVIDLTSPAVEPQRTLEEVLGMPPPAPVIAPRMLDAVDEDDDEEA